MYATVGGLLYAVNQADGMIVLSGAAQRAKELTELARHNPALYKALKAMTQGSALIAFIAGHVGMLMAIAANHNLLPAELVGGLLAVNSAATQAKEQAASAMAEMQAMMNGNVGAADALMYAG